MYEVKRHETRKAYRILMGKRLEKWPLGKPRLRRESGIKTDIRVTGRVVDGMDSGSCAKANFARSSSATTHLIN
jgi:hypothetical protein